LLLSSNTLAGRVVSALETAGEACVEVKTHRAFLLHAIALESVILGKQTQSELTFQLSSRVAHLLGSDLNARKNIAKTVNDLYSLRSKIVHTGATDVSISELELITQITLNTLYALLRLRPFTEMIKIEQYEQWFKDRMLGAADDIG
jgi:Apea-like HEPN